MHLGPKHIQSRALKMNQRMHMHVYFPVYRAPFLRAPMYSLVLSHVNFKRLKYLVPKKLWQWVQLEHMALAVRQVVKGLLCSLSPQVGASTIAVPAICRIIAIIIPRIAGPVSPPIIVVLIW